MVDSTDEGMVRIIDAAGIGRYSFSMLPPAGTRDGRRRPEQVIIDGEQRVKARPRFPVVIVRRSVIESATIDKTRSGEPSFIIPASQSRILS
jgi:hypothetical protein